MTEFGDELRRLLAQRGISLSAAAREAGCSKGYLSNAANGRKALTPRVAAGCPFTGCREWVSADGGQWR